MTARFNVLTAVEDAITTGSVDRQSMLLRHITDLFLVGSHRYSDEEIALFDDVFNRLTAEIEISARALLAIRLAPIPHAPPRIIRTLAFDDAIEVAGPVLAQSQQLDDPTLVENAKKKGQEHLLAISRRQSLSELVTDVLVVRGDQQVVWSTAQNHGASFSEAGFKILVQRSGGDDKLAACVGARPDIPPELFLKLLQQASQHVRAKLEAEHPRAKRIVQQVVGEVVDRIQVEAFDRSSDGFDSPTSIKSLHQSGQLDDDRIRAFAEDGQIAETAAALALMCQLPIHFVERVMDQERSETILVLTRAIGLSWSTAKAILQLRVGKRLVLASEIAKNLASFERLNPATAREIVSFYQAREQTGMRQSS